MDWNVQQRRRVPCPLPWLTWAAMPIVCMATVHLPSLAMTVANRQRFVHRTLAWTRRLTLRQASCHRQRPALHELTESFGAEWSDVSSRHAKGHRGADPRAPPLPIRSGRSIIDR